MKIEKTKLYRQFKLIGTNREVNEAHVRDLVSSISEVNLLPYNPIIVNSKMEVIDGQHRLEAAKRLGLDIYYVVAGGSIKETRLLNRANRSWSLINYLVSYAKEGNPEAIKLYKFVDLYRIPVSTAIELACGDYDSSKGRALRRGELKLQDDLAEAHNVAKKLTSLQPYCERGAFRSRTLIRAIRRMDQAKIDFIKLAETLEKTGIKIKDNTNYRDLLRQFEDIVNYKRSKTVVRLY